MTISTSLFHQSTTRDLSKINEKIASIQGQVSSGKNDPRSSADPVRALRLSAAHEQEEALNRFSSNIERAQLRLDQADTVLEEGVNTMRRIGELAVRASSDNATQGERDSIAAEVTQLRATLLGLANTRDDFHQPLFGGYMTSEDPFQDGPNGVVYKGDGGQSRLKISESMSLPTGIDGARVFQDATNGSGGDIFAVIDHFLIDLGGNTQKRDAVISGQDSLILAPALGRDASELSFTISGPLGDAEVEIAVAQHATENAVNLINAQSTETGVTATLDPETGRIVLTANGDLSVSDLGASSSPITVVDDKGLAMTLVPENETRSAVLGKLHSATDHLIDQRTTLGALSANAGNQADVIEGRMMFINQTKANLEDLDLTDALTRLQQSMLTRDAALQAYVKITQKNLFDYMR